MNNINNHNYNNDNNNTNNDDRPRLSWIPGDSKWGLWRKSFCTFPGIYEDSTIRVHVKFQPAREMMM